MFPEDRLTRAERIRLECLSQSLSITVMTESSRPLFKHILDNAEKIERWLKQAREDA